MSGNNALWISRHPMDVQAEAELRKIFGIEGIDSVDFVFSESPQMAWIELKRLINDYEFFGGVFPAQVWFAMIEFQGSRMLSNKTMFLVISKAVNAEGGVRQFQFDHIEWYEF